MNIREPILPGPWYPRDPAKIDEFLLPFRRNQAEKSGMTAIAPHAGWFYSGKIAARSISSLDKSADTVIVIGGHLPASAPALFAEENAIRTPYGLLSIDRELRDLLREKLNGKSDVYQDNTVEVLMPMVHAFYPKSCVVWARFPACLSAYEMGKIIADAGKSLGRRLVVLGSTDLTHYGANYGYSPKGSGQKALDWVKNVNDAAFIRAVLDHDPGKVLHCAERDYSSCSVGAVLGVLGFIFQTEKIQNGGGLKGNLAEYGASADAGSGEIPDSFVGYASIIWS